MTLETMKDSKAAAWTALVVGLVGIVTHPDILGILPSHWSGIITAAAVLLQGITKSLFGDK